MKEKNKILVTSALPYANGPLHFGHIAGAYLPGDCYARFQRLKGNTVLYICGSDEHGVAITLSADLAKRTPQEHVDIFHKINLNFFKQLNFSFDHYSRTTWPGHYETAQQFFKDLYDNGYIEERVENHLYSEEEKRFLADRYVVGVCPKCGFEGARGDECQKCGASYEAIDLKNPKSKLTNSPLTLKPSKHWYLRFDMFKDRLTEWLSTKKWKPNVINFTLPYVRDLKPRGITRDSDWGVPVPLPDAKGKVLYVWFDAPIGYISATKEWAQLQGKPNLWEEFWLDPKVKLVNFIGKDNIPFHTVFFPAMIMGQNIPYKLPDEVPANEFFLLEGRQFSKSEGWYIDLNDFFSKYTADQIRYYLAANAPETADSEFSWKDFQIKCNSELLGKLGNFVNRTLVFAREHSGAKIPNKHELSDIDQTFISDREKLLNEIFNCYDTFQLRKATNVLMELSHLANTYFDTKKPWQYSKKEGGVSDMETTIYLCIDTIKLLSLIASPIIPETAQKMFAMCGFKGTLSKLLWENVVLEEPVIGTSFPSPQILFRKIEDSEIEEQIAKLGKIGKEEHFKKEITFDDFEKLDLRVGKILKAEKVEKSKKLLKLEVDLGVEIRTIVSGIANFYDPTALIGKKVVVVANLKPAKLMGIESRGMLLSGSDDTNLELLNIQNLKEGSKIS